MTIEEELEQQEKNEAEKIKKVRLLYQRVFCSSDGQLVLTDMLNDLAFFSQHLHSTEQLVLNNFARKILWKIGAWQEFNRFDITRALTRLPKSSPGETRPEEESERGITIGKRRSGKTTSMSRKEKE